MKYMLLLGRFLYSLIFILAGFTHFSEATIQFGASQQIPWPAFSVPFSGIVILVGGLSLLLGYKARGGAWLIVIFLLPATFMMHDFWNATDPKIAIIQQVMFLKNLSMLGGALVIAYFGSGPLSLENESKLPI